MSDVARGECLCGAVRFRVVSGPLHSVALCHCGMCRRWHGHIGAYTGAPRLGLRFEEDRGLAWYQSSTFARRGFCRECGSSLFWDRPDRETIAIAAGTLDAPTGLDTTLQIHVEDHGDYYRVDSSIPIRPSAEEG
jgi:hypothetical protein